MKKTELKQLKDLVRDYLQLKELTASQEKQMEGFKEVIETIAANNPADFVDGEMLIDGVGLLKYVQKAPKLVYIASGKSLNDIETVGFVTELEKVGTGFKKVTLNMTKLKNLVEAKNGAIQTLLTNNGLELQMGERLDVKKLGK